MDPRSTDWAGDDTSRGQIKNRLNSYKKIGKNSRFGLKNQEILAKLAIFGNSFAR
jgi:hypothetical protein